VSDIENLPSYRELPVQAGAPPGSSWGLWGDDDQLGTLNLLTDDRTRRATAMVQRGAVFPLNLPFHELDPQLAWRTPVRHHLLHVGHEAVADSAEHEASRWASDDAAFVVTRDLADGCPSSSKRAVWPNSGGSSSRGVWSTQQPGRHVLHVSQRGPLGCVGVAIRDGVEDLAVIGLVTGT